MANLFRQIVSEKIPPDFLSEQHRNLCNFVALQLARTVSSLEQAEESATKMLHEVVAEDSRFNIAEKHSLKLKSGDGPNLAIRTMLRASPLLLDLGICLLISPNKGEFVTSDSPVVLYNQLMEPEKKLHHLGFLSKGLQIFYPLSPEVGLMMFDRSVYRMVGGVNSKVLTLNQKDIDQLNVLQFASCVENVFFRDYAQSRVGEIASLGRGFRPKSRVNIHATQMTRKADGRISKYVGTNPVGVRTNLTLSFLKLTKPQKQWLRLRQESESKSVVVVRNLLLAELFEEFQGEVKALKRKPSDFLKFLLDRGILLEALFGKNSFC